jgi:aspartate ammonia-lyase
VRQAQESIGATAGRLEELGIGGSAVGTGMNAPPGFREGIVAKLANVTGIDFRSASDLCASMQSNFPIALHSSSLRLAAVEISRICNDLRLLSSGPATGLMEIHLPEAQPGSSIMPGKINPSIPEMVNMVCFQVIGNDAAIAWAAGAGQLELNVMMPIMAHNLLQSQQILENSLRVLSNRCILGITADAARCRRFAESSTALATVLNPHIGYDRTAEIVKEALASRRSVMEVAREKSGLSEEELVRLFNITAVGCG